MSETLAKFAANLQYEDIPKPVIARAKDLFLDWFGSALAGKGARPVAALERFAIAMGPATGPSEILTSRRRTSPVFAAMVNAAASHYAEQDDVHNGSVFHRSRRISSRACHRAIDRCNRTRVSDRGYRRL